jgi:hypothetical protein
MTIRKAKFAVCYLLFVISFEPKPRMTACDVGGLSIGNNRLRIAVTPPPDKYYGHFQNQVGG